MIPLTLEMVQTQISCSQNRNYWVGHSHVQTLNAEWQQRGLYKTPSAQTTTRAAHICQVTVPILCPIQNNTFIPNPVKLGDSCNTT